jgi:hypothetical protein
MYQFQPAHVGFILQILPEVEVVHVLVDETERVLLGRVHPHERHCVCIPVAKEVAYVDFVAKPLRGDGQQRCDFNTTLRPLCFPSQMSANPPAPIGCPPTISIIYGPSQRQVDGKDDRRP